MDDVRFLSIAESCTFDDETGVALLCLVQDLSTDVLTFTIAIGPDEQNLRISRLGRNVSRNRRLVLAEC